MVVTFPAGAGNDAVGRILAERMRGSLGQPIVIENVTGAEGSIGTGRAARAKPDGYTIVFGGADTHVINGALYSLGGLNNQVQHLSGRVLRWEATTSI